MRSRSDIAHVVAAAVPMLCGHCIEAAALFGSQALDSIMNLRAKAKLARVAVFVDAENISPYAISSILEEAADAGRLVSARVYGPPSVLGNAACLRAIGATALKPVVCDGPIKGKNSIDIRIVIDAVEMLLADGADIFAIASGDSDFFPLVERIRESGKKTIGFGTTTANGNYRNACDRFVVLASKKKPANAPQAHPRTFDEIHETIRAAIKKFADPDGWCSMSKAANHVQKTYPGFSPKECGYSTLRKMLTDMSDVDVMSSNSATDCYLRVNPRR